MLSTEVAPFIMYYVMQFTVSSIVWKFSCSVMNDMSSSKLKSIHHLLKANSGFTGVMNFSNALGNVLWSLSSIRGIWISIKKWLYPKWAILANLLSLYVPFVSRLFCSLLQVNCKFLKMFAVFEHLTKNSADLQ